MCRYKMYSFVMEKAEDPSDGAEDSKKKPLWEKIWKIFIFILLWLGLGSTYLSRKPFGIIKSGIQESYNTTENALGYMDLAFSLPYALVSILFGSIGDRISPTLVLGGGLIGSALVSLPMGYTTSYIQILVFLFAIGVFQSLTWPASCGILSIWFPQDDKAGIVSIFNSAALVGSIVSSLLTVYMEQASGWRSVFWVPTIICTVTGLLIIMLIRIRVTEPADADGKTVSEEKVAKKGLPIWKTLRLPLVPELAIVLFCIKAGRNAIIFWLPYYLLKIMDYTITEAGLFALTAEIGGVSGSIVVSILIDKLCKGKEIFVGIFTSLACVGVLVALTFSIGFGRIGQVALMVSIGAFLTSSELIFGGAVPIRVGETHDARASVTSVVNGIGSLGGVAEGLLIGYASKYFGMHSVPYVMAGFIFLACLVSIKAEIVNRNMTKMNNVPKV